jgi:hypothetical protein
MIEITLLGTGSPIPDPNRAGPSTLVRAGHLRLCTPQRRTIEHLTRTFTSGAVRLSLRQSCPLDDVPEEDREFVSPPSIRAGDDVFYGAWDKWVRVDRVAAGPQPRYSTWRLEEHEPGKWTFHHSFPDYGMGPMASGPVERRKHSRP